MDAGEIAVWILGAVGTTSTLMLVGFFAYEGLVALRNRGRASRAPSPAERRALAGLLPRVDLARVTLVEEAAIPAFVGVQGITFGRRIYLGARLAGTPADLRLLLHELKHVDQYQRLTQPLFALGYLWGFVLGGFRYRRIPLEREAYDFEDRHADGLREGTRSMHETVVFDLGGVLIDWNPRFLYRSLIEDEHEMEAFLTEVCTPGWNAAMDEGRSFADVAAPLRERYPGRAHLIDAWLERWPEMLGGAIEANVAVLEALAERGVRLLALTNWSAETWPHALERFPFLDRFEGILVSGREGMKKPDPRYFELLIERFDVDPSNAVFIDDVLENVEAAQALGFETVHLRPDTDLAAELAVSPSS